MHRCTWARGPLPLRKGALVPLRDVRPPLHVVAGSLRIQGPDLRDAGQTSADRALERRLGFADCRSAHLPHFAASCAARLVDHDGRLQTRDTSFEVPAKLLPGHSYRITLGAGVRDEYGQTMARDEGSTVQVRDLDPAVAIGLTGTVLEATSGLPTVGVSSVNLASYTLLSGALDEHGVAALMARGGEERVGAFERLSALPGLTTRRVTQSVRQNVPSTKQVPLAPLLASRGGRGALVVATEFAGRSGPARQVKVVERHRNLAITAKMSRFGSLVWVTRLSDGRPVGGATVAVVDSEKTLYEAQTDAEGLAVITSAQYSPLGDEGTIDSARIVVARKDGDWTWRAVNDVLPAGAGLDWVDEAGRMDPLGMLFTDRGVYRPGEAMKLQAIFRMPEPRGTSTPAKRAITVQATDAQGETLFDGRATLDAFGAATVDLPLPVTAHLGDMSIAAKLAGAREGAPGATTSVQLAAYKASEFKAAVEAAATSWTRGDHASFDVHGDYLFGAPMAGAKVRWTATRTRTSFTPPGAEDLVADDEAYSADLPDRSPRAERLQAGDALLDAHGATRVPLALDFTGPAVPEMVTLEADVQDVSRQTVAASAGALVHPASFYVALHSPQDYLLPKGTPPVASVVALRAERASSRGRIGARDVGASHMDERPRIR